VHARALFGQWGERQAGIYLETKGFSIIARNYHCPHGELDIIATKDGAITFVEVKSRQTLKYGRPAEAVTKQKQRKIHACAFYYLQQQRRYYRRMWFDVIEIYLEEGKPILNHIEHCF
jgi:putative endonuclease